MFHISFTHFDTSTTPKPRKMSTAAMETSSTSATKPVAKPCNKKLWGVLAFISIVGGTVVSALGNLPCPDHACLPFALR